MTPDGPALLASVLAHPHDDAPRLIYADWLDEHGDPDRAELIRVQCALAYRKVRVGDRPRAFELLERQAKGEPLPARATTAVLLARELLRLERHAVTWEERDGNRLRMSWVRGFVEVVTCKLAAWVARGPWVVKEHPVRLVGVSDRRPSNDGDRWAWFRADADDPLGYRPQVGRAAAWYYLPLPIFDAMPGEQVWEGWPVKYYPGAAEAVAALSAGLIAWAKGKGR